MASSKNLIQSLRSAHDPHFKLEGRVEGLEKNIPIQVAQLHKTLSKSFGMQRKTLVRVLGLENRLSNLEVAIEAWTVREGLRRKKEAEQKIEGEAEVDGENEVEAEGEGELPAETEVEGEGERPVEGEVEGEGEGERPAEGEVGGDDDKPSKGVSTLITPPKKIKAKKKKIKAKKKKLKAKRKKIKAADIKKGTALATLDNDFGSRVMGKDEKGEYLSKEERIARFKGEKFDPESVKPQDESGGESQGESGGESKAEKVLNSIAAPISAIADTMDSIFNTLKEQFDQQKDTKEDNRIKQEQADAKKDEKSLEKGGLKKGLEKKSKEVLSPFKSIWDKLVNFLTTILFGKVVMKVMDWFGNPENAEKVKSFVRFLRDWWPVLLAGIMAFMPALLGPGGMILGTVVLVAWALPKIMDVVKWLGELPSKIVSFLTGGEKDLEKAEKDAGKDLEGVTGDDKEEPKQEDMGRPADTFVDKKEEPQKFNKGGQVPGSGNKDTVPAMLTPGEFVMSKGAVQKYGVDTLEGLNAAAGGTNSPTLMRQYKEGGTATPMTSEEIAAATGPSLQMFMEQQNAAVDENPEAYNGIKLKLDRDGKVPNFGEFIMAQGEAEFNKGLEMLQNNESVEPEVKEALVKKALFIRSQTLEDPNFKADIAFDINKDIPGTAANRLFLKAQADTSSPAALAGLSARDRALQMNRMGYSGGGLVQNIFGGAKNVFNMLPQVKAAKWLGGKAKDMFKKGKEFVGNAFDKSANISPPGSKKVKVITLPSKGSKQQGTNSLIGSSDIPEFNVVHPNRKIAKQKTLGITN